MGSCWIQPPVFKARFGGNIVAQADRLARQRHQPNTEPKMAWDMKNDAALRSRAARVIPNGMYGHQSVRRFPATYPQFFDRAKGCRLCDVDGHEYIDYLCGYGPILLGYHHPRVDAAAARQKRKGDTMTGPSSVMVDLAEKLVGMVSHADWAVFCKNGTDATSTALLVAREYRSRRKILVAKGSYHGSAAWCTPLPGGVLKEDRAHFLYFEYNNLESLERAAEEAGDDLAGIIVTPLKHDVRVDQELVAPTFAARCRSICDDKDALLILDDVRAGFRMERDSSWARLGVKPDLSAWGKAIGNGYPISALLGNERTHATMPKIYATGSYWFSAVAMAAAIATLDEIENSDYLEHTIRVGEMLRAGLDKQAAAHGVPIRQTGPVQMPQVLFDDDPDYRNSFTWGECCIQNGVYFHPWHNMFLSAAHTEADIAQTLEVTDRAFGALAATRLVGTSAIA
jgi:glutamate-1-semialdehyde 2,1-aminomutase